MPTTQYFNISRHKSSHKLLPVRLEILLKQQGSMQLYVESEYETAAEKKNIEKIT